VGSCFYGSLLGVFVLAVATRANAPGALAGLLAGMTTVAFVGWLTPIAYLWQNVLGTLVVVVVGLVVTMVVPGARPAHAPLAQKD
jgi:solute:Na+ symporter, SSS family